MPLTGIYEPSPIESAREQADIYEATNGAELGTLLGAPIIVLTSRGARTGAIRKNPLIRIEHDGEYAVIASNGGSTTHPSWFHNLVAHPDVELQDGPIKRDYHARQVQGDERRAWWARAVAAWPDFAVYPSRAKRTIPVFVLTPVQP